MGNTQSQVRRCYLNNMLYIVRGYCKETYEDHGLKHLYERHHSCVNFAMVSYVKEVKRVNIQLIISKMTCFNWKMKKYHVTICLWIIQK